MKDYGDFKEGRTDAYENLQDLRQEYDDLKNDWNYIKSLLDSEFEKNIDLKRENEQLNSENNQLKIKNRGLQAELKIRKADVDYADKINNELFDECKQYKKENEQLKFDKQQLHMAMSREMVRHKQFKDKLFDVINEKIKELEIDLNESIRVGMPTGALRGEVSLLEELKEELQK